MRKSLLLLLLVPAIDGCKLITSTSGSVSPTPSSAPSTAPSSTAPPPAAAVPAQKPATLELSDGPILDFGATAIGASTDRTLSVTPSGDVPATEVSAGALSGGFAFKNGSYPGTGGTCATSIAAPCTMVVTFSPGSTTASTVNLELSYNTGSGSAQATRAMTGVGLNIAALSISGIDPIAYGSLGIGSFRDRTLTITNSGQIAATGLGASSASPLAAPFSFAGGSFPGLGGTCGSSLSGGSSCTIVIRYAPSSLTTSNANLALTYNDGATSGRTLTRSLSGTGQSAPGTPDSSFGTAGKAHGRALDFGFDLINATALQADGRIVVAGHAQLGYDSWAIARYLTDGSLDPTFGTGGVTTIDLSLGHDRANALAIQADGKIVVAGVSGFGGSDIGLVRLNSNGALDTSFSGDGIVVDNPSSSSDVAQAVTVQSDGKIIVAGQCTAAGNVRICLKRYTANGAGDATFGAGGYVSTVLGTGSSGAYGVRVDGAGKVLVAGYVFNGANAAEVITLRYNSDGTLDTDADADPATHWNHAGYNITTVSTGSDYGYAMTVQSDGKLVVGGPSSNSSGFTVVRYNTDGTLDAGFDGDGIATAALGVSTMTLESIALQGDGKIVAVGHTWASPMTDYDWAMVRFNSNGTLDTTFDTDGKLLLDCGNGGNDRAFDVAVQADGNIVVVGAANVGTNTDFGLVRLSSTGALDAAFGTGGKVATNVGYSPAYVFASAAQPDGKILVGGTYYVNTGTTGFGAQFHSFVARYGADGAADASFGANGVLARAFSSTDDRIYGLAVLGDGKIIAAGSYYDSFNSTSDFLVTRLTSGGALDTTFGTSGKTTTAMSSGGSDYAQGVVVQSDGKIVLGGYATVSSYYQFAAARYTAAGTLDTTFGTAGKFMASIDTDHDPAYAIALQSDDKIVLAGAAYKAGNYDFAVLRLTANGAPDAGFGTSGVVTRAVGSGQDIAYAVGVQPDGKIVVGGRSSNGTDNDFALLRLTASGAPDTGFGTGGVVTTAMGGGHDEIRSLLVNADGRILVAGAADETAGAGIYDFALAQYQPDGTLDSAFGSSGKKISAFAPGNIDAAYALCALPDGKVIAAGYGANSASAYAYGVSLLKLWP